MASRILDNSKEKEKKRFSIIFIDNFADKLAKSIQTYASWSTSSLKSGLTVVFV